MIGGRNFGPNRTEVVKGNSVLGNTRQKQLVLDWIQTVVTDIAELCVGLVFAGICIYSAITGERIRMGHAFQRTVAHTGPSATDCVAISYRGNRDFLGLRLFDPYARTPLGCHTVQVRRVVTGP